MLVFNAFALTKGSLTQLKSNFSSLIVAKRAFRKILGFTFLVESFFLTIKCHNLNFADMTIIYNNPFM